MKFRILLLLVCAVLRLSAGESVVTVECNKKGPSDLVKKFDMCQTGWCKPKKWQRVAKGRVAPLGCKQVRFVGALLHKRWGGTPMNKETLELLQKEGAAPYICMDPNPLVKGKNNVHSFPDNVKAWRKLVREAAEQGKKFNCAWYEVWNEPNHSNFWKGTQQELFRMYNIMVQEVLKVHPNAKFVSPGITSAGIPTWLGPFLDYVEKHNLPLHAIAFHDFGRDYSLADQWIMNHVRDVQKEINKRPKFKQMDLEIHVGECSFFPDPKNGDAADRAEAAAHLPGFFKILLQEPQLTLVQWAQLFDTGHDGHWGNLGVIDTELSKQKPIYNVFLMYAMMPVKSCKYSETGDVRCLASQDEKTVAVMLYNETDKPAGCRLTIKEHGFSQGSNVYKYMFAVDPKHSSFHETPGNGNLELLEKKQIIIPEGDIVFNYNMDGPSVKLIMVSSEPVEYDRYVIDRKIIGLPAERDMVQGVTISELSYYAEKLQPGHSVRGIIHSLKRKTRRNDKQAAEAEKILESINKWISTEIKRARAFADITPAHAMLKLDMLCTTLRGMNQGEEAEELYRKLKSNTQVRELARLIQERQRLTKLVEKMGDHPGVSRNRTRLQVKLKKYISQENISPELKDEAQEILAEL